VAEESEPGEKVVESLARCQCEIPCCSKEEEVVGIRQDLGGSLACVSDEALARGAAVGVCRSSVLRRISARVGLA
jgi:hypothetical protein